ncbi:MAG: hypothetical protein JNL60_15340 [Bacteroidia bacterium]|nr:hypothetical protein [Bacteroidia bacterium]
MVRFPKYLMFFLSLSLRLISQNETNNWYFGQYAGLNFSTNPPSAVLNSTMFASSGCSSVSDAAGNLLFYTNGQTVWNKNHQIMANGTGLWGVYGPSQSGLIVKKPGSSSIYYIFSTGWYYFAYSIVDMSLASGTGSVTIKNKNVYQWAVGSSVAATKHCNGEDVWIITVGSPSYFNSCLSAFKLSSTGLDTVGIQSSTTQFGYPVGTLKVSPNGRKIAATNYGYYNDSSVVELFDFDNSTGVASNLQILLGDTAIKKIFGTEFSPDGSKLYAASYLPNRIYQWDLCAGSTSAIVASQYTAASTPSNVQLMAMQLASDGKIYVCKSFRKYMAAIKNPNASGSSCNYVDSAVSIAPGSNNYGLPSFVSSYFEEKPSMTTNYNISQSCLTASFDVSQALTCPSTGYSLSNLSWSFGDPASGNSNTSVLTNPVHHFSLAGTYTVTLIVNYNCSSDTIKKVITVGPQLQLAANRKAVVCAGDSIELSASGADSYLWQDGSSGDHLNISPSVSAYYTVIGTSSTLGCSRKDSVYVTVLDCTGLKEFQNQEYRLTVFPNPSHGEVEINAGKSGQIFLLNELGQELARFYLGAENKYQVKLSGLQSGVYLIKMDYMVRKIVVN